MGLLMEAATENNKEVVILDRPNPLGGKRIEGNIVEDGYFSFVSQFAIPYLHGLTAVSYTHLRAHETVLDLVCRLLLEKKKHHTQDNTHTFKPT